jgi:hypothetical protein
MGCCHFLNGLREAAEQMRAELLVLNELLEQLPAMAEQTDREQRDHERELNDLTNQLATEPLNHSFLFSCFEEYD